MATTPARTPWRTRAARPTAFSFRTSTTTYAKRLADGDPVVREQVTLPNVIAFPDGLPIKAAKKRGALSCIYSNEKR